MGREKASLPHPDGGTFLGHAVSRLAGLCDHVCVAGGSDLAVEAELLEDPQPHRGPVMGIATALSFAEERGYAACLVTPVDMPFLTAEDLTRIRDAWAREKKLCCGQSVADERLQPLVAVYPVTYRAAIGQLADSDQRSLTRWIAAQQPRLVPLAAESCRNVNTPEDLSE
jgi:molybdopterin-guanine dinucleotide biosynthesis protein A